MNKYIRMYLFLCLRLTTYDLERSDGQLGLFEVQKWYKRVFEKL